VDGDQKREGDDIVKIIGGARKAVAKVQAAREAMEKCANCKRKPARRGSNTCGKTCEGALLHKIMNGHV
jgi:hypothetical protein